MGKLAKRKIDIRKKNYLYYLSIVYTTLFRKWLKCSLQLCIASPFRKKEAFVRWNIPVKCFNDIIKRHQKPNNKKLCGFATLLINQNKISNFRFYETKNCVRHLPSLPLIFRPRVFLTEKQNKHNVSTILKMMKWENKTLFRNKKYMLNKIPSLVKCFLICYIFGIWYPK